ncbi:MAG TPA: hypothetical protein VFM61_09310, partial [Pseudidiomarina sp.]|nr:hypothetical protein [Pseudidiomarina sp.]
MTSINKASSSPIEPSKKRPVSGRSNPSAATLMTNQTRLDSIKEKSERYVNPFYLADNYALFSALILLPELYVNLIWLPCLPHKYKTQTPARTAAFVWL